MIDMNMNVKKNKNKLHITFMVKMWLSKNYFSNFYQMSSEDLNSRSVVHKTNAFDHWAMMILLDQYEQFHRISK